MNLDAATQAVRHKLGTLWPEPYLTEISREIAGAVLAALPEPIGYRVLPTGEEPTMSLQEAAELASHLSQGQTSWRIAALVPVDKP